MATARLHPQLRENRSFVMVGFLIRAAVVAVGLWVAQQIVPGVHFSTGESLIWAALLLGVVNAFVRPVLVFLTFPITLLTLGLFLLVINGLMVELAAHFVEGFSVSGLMPAILTSLVVSFTSWVMSGFIGSGGFETMAVRR
jgi:putative membrane protein